MPNVTRSQTEMPAGENSRFNDLESKLDKLLNLQTVTNTLLSSVVQRVDALDKKTETLIGDMHEQVVMQEAYQPCIIELENKLQLAMDYIDQLENRHRQNNLLLNVLESLEENMGMFAFLVKLLDRVENKREGRGF